MVPRIQSHQIIISVQYLLCLTVPFSWIRGRDHIHCDAIFSRQDARPRDRRHFMGPVDSTDSMHSFLDEQSAVKALSPHQQRRRYLHSRFLYLGGDLPDIVSLIIVAGMIRHPWYAPVLHRYHNTFKSRAPASTAILRTDEFRPDRDGYRHPWPSSEHK